VDTIALHISYLYSNLFMELPHVDFLKISAVNNRGVVHREIFNRDTITIQNVEEAKDTIKTNDIVLFMKGTKDMPGCGFSAHVVQILNKMNVKYIDVDILHDDNFKENMKKFTNWPTFPQLYVKGEFVGGCDIIKEMFESGELLELFNTKGIDVKI